MEYVKINSLWKRQGWYFEQNKKKSQEYQDGRQSFITGDYAEEEFGNIKKWHVEEKVDGTNIRIMYKDGKVTFGGRTDNAQIPCNLLQHLVDTFTETAMHKAFPCAEDQPYPNVVVYGEGYGPKIQSAGGNYRRDVGLIMFDVRVGGWWLKREDVTNIASVLQVPMCPSLGLMVENQIVEFVKSKPLSLCSMNPQMMEGVICRSDPLVLFRNGKPLMWKLKCKEF